MTPTNRSLRARLEAVLLRHWYPSDAKKTWLAWLLLPASALFAQFARRKCARARRKLCFDAQRSVDAVVVVVGNITTGGTGKTPLLIELASRLIQCNYRVAVLSKGYGGSHLRSGGAPRLVAQLDNSALVGDEPLLLARTLAAVQAQHNQTGQASAQPPPPVLICRERMDGLQWLLSSGLESEIETGLQSAAQRPGFDIVLCDDGLQHYALPRDLEYIVVDAQRGFGNGCLLPAGPLREPHARLALADRIVINGGDLGGELREELREELRGDLAGGQDLADRVCTMQVVSAGAQRLGDGGAAPPIESLATVLAGVDAAIAVTGTGNPARFFAGLAECAPGAELHTATFPDHHHFSEADFLGLLEQQNNTLQAVARGPTVRRAFFVTGKDAVKIASFANRLPLPIYAVGIEVELPQAALEPILRACEQLQVWREQTTSAET